MPSPRHGHGGHSTVPVRLGPSGPLPPSPRGGGGGGGGGAPPPPPTCPPLPKSAFGAISVSLLRGFLSSFPAPDIQQVARHDSVDPAFADTVYPNYATDITSLTVPSGMVMILTDIEFFITAPSPTLQGTLQKYPSHAFAGVIRWRLLFNDRTPLEMEGTFLDPLSSHSAATGLKSGWPFLNRSFGVSRAPAFALYAREDTTIKAQYLVDDLVIGVVSSMGVILEGFTLPVVTFSKLFNEV